MLEQRISSAACFEHSISPASIVCSRRGTHSRMSGATFLIYALAISVAATFLRAADTHMPSTAANSHLSTNRFSGSSPLKNPLTVLGGSSHASPLDLLSKDSTPLPQAVLAHSFWTIWVSWHL